MPGLVLGGSDRLGWMLQCGKNRELIEPQVRL